MSDDSPGNPDRLSVRGPHEGHAFAVAAVREPTDPTHAAEGAYGHLASWLQKHGLTIVHERLFGSRDVAPAVQAARRRTLDGAGVESGGPFTYVAAHPDWSGRWAGVVVHAVQNAAVLAVRDAQERWCGRRWSCGDLDWMVCQNLPTDVGGGSDEDAVRCARGAIEQADSLLIAQGLGYRNVVRTWFYLDHITSWYDRFNAIRRAKYKEFRLMPRADAHPLRLPASTGIGAGTSAGRPAGLDLLAVAPRASRATVIQLSNPAQMDAFEYGSAFSRGAIVRAAGLTLMEVSGTASIDEHGRTIHPQDFELQVGATLDRLERLLEPAKARLADVCAATAFVKRPADVARFWQMLEARGLSQLPVVGVVADICREELLFELDAELMW